MAKKTAPKKKSSAKKRAHSTVYVGYITVIFGVFMLFFVVSFGYHTLFQPQVLGSSTSLLAEGGDGSGGGSGSGDFGSNSSGGASDNQESGDKPPAANPPPGGAGFSGNTVVSCTLPDGTVFQTTSANCRDLVERSQQRSVQNTGSHAGTSGHHDFGTNASITPIPESDNTSDTHRGGLSNSQTGIVHVKNQDGKLLLTIEHPDGTESELDDNALHDLNDKLEGSNSAQIDQDGNGFLLKQGSVSARTHFPLSIDVTTGQLSVTTPAGTKQVAILPEQAVNNLISHGVITDVTHDASVSASQVDLTEAQNQPVFSIAGISKKHFLGLIPVSIHKTVDVSTITGQTVSEGESFAQKLLDLLSF